MHALSFWKCVLGIVTGCMVVQFHTKGRHAPSGLRFHDQWESVALRDFGSDGGCHPRFWWNCSDKRNQKETGPFHCWKFKPKLVPVWTGWIINAILASTTLSSTTVTAVWDPQMWHCRASTIRFVQKEYAAQFECFSLYFFFSVKKFLNTPETSTTSIWDFVLIILMMTIK